MSQEKKCKLTRRKFLKGGLAVGGLTLLTPAFASQGVESNSGIEKLWLDDPHGTGNDKDEYDATNVIYSLCEQCNTHCTLKAVVTEAGVAASPAVVRKIAGNPYSPLNTQPFGQIPYDTSPEKAAKGYGKLGKDGRGFRGGRTCLKGQAGIQTTFDNLRIKQPLKRVGPRGSGKFKSISWQQAITEIVEGSDLGTPGLKDIWAYVSKEQVMADWEKVKNGELSQEKFDELYKDKLIDTRHPDFGPKSNQVVSLVGDRRDFIQKRFWSKSLGSVNTIHHGGICGMSGVQGNIHSFTGGKKKRMYSDVDNAEFVIIWGTDPFVANKGPTWLAPKFVNALARGMKLAVVDPRMSKAAEKAHIWVPILPGTDAALAMGMARWIIENKRFDRRYLENPNKKAAEADGEPTWSDATHLVNLSDPKRPKLKAADLGIGSKDQYVVVQNGQPVPHDQAAEGTLEVDTTINGIRVKSAFTLFKERVFEKTLEEYAKICDITVEKIIELAREFTSYGKKASITSYRGPAMHTNGFYNLRAINCLNHLLGNYDWKGGSISSGAKYQCFKGQYDVLNMPRTLKPWGTTIFRKGSYEKSSLFEKDGYPAKRPWFPYSNHVTQEVLPSIDQEYPYGIKALFIHRISPVLSVAGGNKQQEVLKDTKKIPLLVVSDITMSETASVADYVLPDLTYLERWGLESIYPNQPLKLSHIQQPVTRAFDGPRAFEDSLIEIGKELGLPGVGKNAFPDGSDLNNAEDFYLKVVANIAFDGQPVPDADAREEEIFKQSRKKALGPYFDENKWRKAVKAHEWKKVVYVLNRGGRFEAPGNEYEGEYLKYKFAGQADFYREDVAKGRHSYSGEFFDGLPRIESTRFYNGNNVGDDQFPLQLINWKARHIGTHRNISDAWLREIDEENFLWINPQDAKVRGLADGDRVIIKSASFKVEGRVRITGRIRQGVVGSSYNYGHFAYGSAPYRLDGRVTDTDPAYGHVPWAVSQNNGYAGRRNAGFSNNDLQRADESFKLGCLSDPIGGGASQLDTKVEVIKA
ncbi:MAG: molybdopterin oxidoreductase, molybdopterin-binding subunit [Clostridiales bacterium]|jgi:anaerobic selenocysteine-containing dehydrogenase|nr:molybdopterin oxidoreductase, molybdopterin-binding subunit [Clostridiales bacterium]